MAKSTLARGVKSLLCIMQVNFRLYFWEIFQSKSDIAILMILQLHIVYTDYRLYRFVSSYRAKTENSMFSVK